MGEDLKTKTAIEWLADNKKGPHFCRPLILLVAGRGFEPLTFGL